jgi:hypothetical protein
MLFEPDQLLASALIVLVVASVCGALVFRRGSRQWGYAVLSACAVLALASWLGFGRFHSIFIDRPPMTDVSQSRPKLERHLPFHFHEFFHYYIGAKYFREFGYLGIYDCATLADLEIAQEDRVPARVNGYVRDLEDVLRDKPYSAAIEDCRQRHRDHFSAARWESFKNDLRELHHLVPDGWWNGGVYDAGFNPPPSWILVGSAPRLLLRDSQGVRASPVGARGDLLRRQLHCQLRLERWRVSSIHVDHRCRFVAGGDEARPVGARWSAARGGGV